ncbi:hypothetical protein GCM10011414_12720 [Croceivirga lutea]|uniref:vWA domain-containing protein n=1 Tax=Croceivirga lutea TaxID=1775167 RepID=UPI001639A8BA|nr:vWA domain-containing protein [Croceivirga lutea]GGG44586.1 hypothetical protein GCM10011414_12720 [Croceivirga lutea]
MAIETLLLIVLAAITALGLAIFQYFFRAKRAKINWVLALLRFLTWFFAFLLLINPKFTSSEPYVEKSNLVVLFDNSSSILNNGLNELNVIKEQFSKTDFSERFALFSHHFDDGLNQLDSLANNGSITNISKALADIGEIYATNPTKVILVTDGNQNVGADYEFYRAKSDVSIYPIIIGDTTKYDDLYVSRASVNRYTFLNNFYPFEVTINYSGRSSENTNLNVYVNGKRVFREHLSFSKKNNSRSIAGQIEATSVGFKTVRFEVEPLSSEKNKVNNSKEVAIEVIDEQTKIGLVSSLLHPDLGALKKAIETNEQRSVTLVQPSISSKDLDDFDFLILYQPNSTFMNVFNQAKQRKIGHFIVTGSQTDWNFLNSVQNNFQKESYRQTEDVEASKNEAFDAFDISELNVESFPPLRFQLGDFAVNTPFRVLLNQKIKGSQLNTPLLFTASSDDAKYAVLQGENIWRWRAKAYQDTKSFSQFDDFIGQLIRYLSDTKPKNRLRLDYNPIFDSPALATISASYFDEAYNFDAKASLMLTITDDSGQVSKVPMLLNNSNYQADLSNLKAGEYTFMVSVEGENFNRSGKFKIVAFNLENQLASSNAEKLLALANNNSGEAYFSNQVDELINNLQVNQEFTPIQKSIKNVVSLIDFRWLLLAIAFCLATEWFIRKYNGLL